MTDSAASAHLDRHALHEHLAHHWDTPRGLRGWLSNLDHKVIGRRYVVTSLVFLALALGLFLGSGFVGDRVNSMTGTSRDRIGDLENERDDLNAKLNASNSFDHAIAAFAQASFAVRFPPIQYHFHARSTRS